MNILDIEAQIIALKEKLRKDNIINLKKKKKKKKTRQNRTKGMSDYLRSYLFEELAKLEKMKIHLQEKTTVVVHADWKDLVFENGKVALKYSNIITEFYYVKISRKSFNFLKIYFKNCNLPKLIFNVCYKQIISIDNYDLFLKTFHILSFYEGLSLDFKKSGKIDLSKHFKKLAEISNDELSNFFKISEKSEYINYLCLIQTSKIVPIVSSIYNNDINSAEDSFLFTMKVSNVYYIIWESIRINKATFIFKAKMNDYDFAIQNIFNYATSNLKSKRLTLRRLIKISSNELGIIKVLEHNNLSNWKQEIQTLSDTDFKG